MSRRLMISIRSLNHRIATKRLLVAYYLFLVAPGSAWVHFFLGAGHQDLGCCRFHTARSPDACWAATQGTAVEAAEFLSKSGNHAHCPCHLAASSGGRESDSCVRAGFWNSAMDDDSQDSSLSQSCLDLQSGFDCLICQWFAQLTCVEFEAEFQMLTAQAPLDELPSLTGISKDYFAWHARGPPLA